MGSDDRLLTTAQVARQLGVKPETVYAYVSRGLLTSIRTPGERGSRFASGEVDRLLGDRPETVGARRAPAGAAERIRTEITLLENDTCAYRGRLSTELAAAYSYEEVAHLLWTGDLAAGDLSFRSSERLGPVARAVVDALPAHARLPERLRVAVAAIGASDQLRFDLAPEAVTAKAAALIGTAVGALRISTGGAGPADVGLAERLWPRLTALPATEARVELLNAALVLLADHDLAASTLAVRVAASVRANIYAVVSTGLGVLEGQAHGGASRPAFRLLADVLEGAPVSGIGDPVAVIAELMRTGQPLPGFGHVTYERADPRAVFLFSILRRLAIVDPRVDRVMRTVDAIVAEVARPGLFPNIDLALAAMAYAYEMPSDAGEVVFAVARIAGWVAHALEEYREPALRFRPPGIYVGPGKSPVED